MVKKISKKSIALGIVALAVAGTIGAVGHELVDNDVALQAQIENLVNESTIASEEASTTIESLQSNISTSNSELALANEKITELEAREPEVVEVAIDNGNLDLLLDTIFDNKGEVAFLTEDLDEDELDQVVPRINFANDVKALAVAEAKAEIADLVNKETVDGVLLDEDDVERVRVQDDDDEVILSDIDYDELDADATLMVRFEQDDIKYEAEVTVEVKDGEVEDIDLNSINLR